MLAVLRIYSFLLESQALVRVPSSIPLKALNFVRLLEHSSMSSVKDSAYTKAVKGRSSSRTRDPSRNR